MKTLYATKNIHIAHCPSTNIMYCNWIGPQCQQDVVQAGITILELLRENQFTKVLNDNTYVTGPWNTAVAWTLQQWFPAMISAGMQHFAWVYSPNIFAHFSARRAMPDYNDVRTFHEYQQALQWLTTTP